MLLLGDPSAEKGSVLLLRFSSQFMAFKLLLALHHPSSCMHLLLLLPEAGDCQSGCLQLAQNSQLSVEYMATPPWAYAWHLCC